ncbi:MAG: hypothetical protein HLUCCA08_17840 [Rhodobacteraceae bacterium HLUCCA08]|nr:MAG: hypothetical protein HLUCCA08_17840 [Rhodobacteraceae bacterium HLUCCA08]
MKRILKTTVICSLVGSSAWAGGMADPVMPVQIVEADTESRSSSAGLLIPLIIVAALIAVASGSDGNGGYVIPE